jgi:hypothetical protein
MRAGMPANHAKLRQKKTENFDEQITLRNHETGFGSGRLCGLVLGKLCRVNAA